MSLSEQAISNAVQHDVGVSDDADYLAVIDSQIDECISVTERLLKMSLSPGQRHMKHASLTDLAFDPDTAAVLFDEMFCDRQS